MEQISSFLKFGELGVLCLTLLGVYTAGMKLVDAFKQNAAVIQANTDMIQKLGEKIKEDNSVKLSLLNDIRDRLMERPCQLDKK